jgi:hypothetical protein
MAVEVGKGGVRSPHGRQEQRDGQEEARAKILPKTHPPSDLLPPARFHLLSL